VTSGAHLPAVSAVSVTGADAAPAAQAAIAAMVADLAAHGHAVARHALGQDAIAGLRERALALRDAGEMRPAGVGRSAAHGVHADIRGDRIRWLDAVPQGAAEEAVRAHLEALRTACNQALMLGLRAFEGHYALFAPGTGYARHLDRFRDDDTRVLSCVLYLNDGWTAADGGALRLETRDGPRDVLPEGGTLVVFLAAEFAHEVRVARRPRLALTGWFRRRALGAWDAPA
jgi:SM-20-related protein